ncbi:MAG: phosphatidylglycerophosphatase A [Thiomonas sp.]|uniref:phosphatidylglycerophosphatase A family protein n=1 Tax=Thiomonas sp. TaxID=2047785 RepID=UPI002A35F910|nr:phosphatidylglycerophosphatase A [Thiomonas sp.]MDY0330586.1 phosphatidylglycerophosphatase A [Thiomonas sp.]
MTASNPIPTVARGASWRFMWRNPLHVLALGFGSGLSPIAPGTAGTLFAWASYALLSLWLGPLVWAVVIGIGAVVGIWACGHTSRALGLEDASPVVWDEIIAFWLVLLLVTPAGWAEQLAAFLLFRAFDAGKWLAVGWADRHVKGGFGIMLDDLIAAAFTLLVMALGIRLYAWV